MIAEPGSWFAQQIAANTETLLWAAGELPPDHLFATPPEPKSLGTWPAARHFFHVLYYEREVALPSLRQWLGEPRPTFEDYDENKAWGAGQPLERVLAELQEMRRRPLEVLASVSDSAWHEERDTAWGPQPRTLYWVASKTYQHATQHASDLLKLLMLWDHYAARADARSRPDVME